MTIHPFEYTILLISCFIFPLIYSVIHRRMLKGYRYYLFNPTVVMAGLPFLLWDIFAVRQGYWMFNDHYTTQWKLINLPIEEYLFFLLIPQSCLLIWVGMKRYSSFHRIVLDIRNHFKKV